MDSEAYEKGKEFEYRIKGLEEGAWRAIQYQDTRTIREAGALYAATLNELADYIDSLRG